MTARIIRNGMGWRSDVCTLCDYSGRTMGKRHYLPGGVIMDFQEGTCKRCCGQWPKFYQQARAEAYYLPRIKAPTLSGNVFIAKPSPMFVAPQWSREEIEGMQRAMYERGLAKHMPPAFKCPHCRTTESSKHPAHDLCVRCTIDEPVAENHSYMNPPYAAHPANVAAMCKRLRIDLP